MESLLQRPRLRRADHAAGAGMDGDGAPDARPGHGREHGGLRLRRRAAVQSRAGVHAPGGVVTVFTSDFSSGPYGDSSYPDFVSIARGIRGVRADRRRSRCARRAGADRATRSSACASRASPGSTSTSLGLSRRTPGRGDRRQRCRHRRERRRRQRRFWRRALRRRAVRDRRDRHAQRPGRHHRRRRAAAVHAGSISRRADRNVDSRWRHRRRLRRRAATAACPSLARLTRGLLRAGRAGAAHRARRAAGARVSRRPTSAPSIVPRSRGR